MPTGIEALKQDQGEQGPQAVEQLASGAWIVYAAGIGYLLSVQGREIGRFPDAGTDAIEQELSARGIPRRGWLSTFALAAPEREHARRKEQAWERYCAEKSAAESIAFKAYQAVIKASEEERDRRKEELMRSHLEEDGRPRPS